MSASSAATALAVRASTPMARARFSASATSAGDSAAVTTAIAWSVAALRLAKTSPSHAAVVPAAPP